jgi:quercetin dioxygenase-like cupin family protein
VGRRNIIAFETAGVRRAFDHPYRAAARNDKTENDLMHRILLLGAAILVCLSGLVAAQDASTAVYKQLLDNNRVRVFEATFKPGSKIATRNYPNHLMYSPTEGTLIFTPAGRTGYEVNFKAGEAVWFPPQARATENDSDHEVRVLVVEFKDGGGARAVKPRGKAKARAKKAPAKPKGKK